jgi:tagatose-6-phosphate ketose/aldose isomerase
LTTTQQTSALEALAEQQPALRDLLDAPIEIQRERGYFHTLREICQQPSTWLATSETMLGAAPAIARSLEGIQSLILTGSGSSEFAGECVRLPLESDLGIFTESIGGGTLLTFASHALPPVRPSLMVSLSRSGDSPESLGTVSMLLETEPDVRHLILTCNAEGGLARAYPNDPRVALVTFDDRTNDRSLVMTSSFTNLALAARFLGYLARRAEYRALCVNLSRIAEGLLRSSFSVFRDLARRDFGRVVFLGDGARFGSAREAALKMLEMTAGRVPVVPETYLGLRHGPMSFVSEDTLIVCFLASDARLRAYEMDLIHELDRKKLGLAKLIVGEGIPRELVREHDAVVACNGLAEVGDENAPVIDVLVGQLLAFFRCLEQGLKPDSPSATGVISRVVETFPLHNAPWDRA